MFHKMFQHAHKLYTKAAVPQIFRFYLPFLWYAHTKVYNELTTSSYKANNKANIMLPSDNVIVRN